MFWRERHTKIFLTQLLCIACLGIMAALLLFCLQENRMRVLLFEHDTAIAAALLEQGGDGQIIAQAIAGAWKEYGKQTLVTAEAWEAGEKLLRLTGVAPDTDIRVIPPLHAFYTKEKATGFSAAVLFILLSFISVMRYLQKRDRIYKEAIAAVEKCAEEDFTLKLPELYDGTLYQLFSHINFMACMLKTGKEAEHKVKDFLKTTVADISHQLKTPLAALSLYQEIMRKEPEQVRTVAHFAERSEAALARIEGLIGTLLKLTRLDAGSVVFGKRVFDAKELVLEALEELRDRARMEEKEILLSGESANIYCDPDWSREALGNLIKNALDHTGNGDQIRIGWEQGALMTRFTVEDSGEGIAEEDIHHIFKRFYQSGNSRDRQGAGLGLSLVKAIAEGQGGTVSVQSEPGRGAAFVLAFPNS